MPGTLLSYPSPRDVFESCPMGPFMTLTTPDPSAFMFWFLCVGDGDRVWFCLCKGWFMWFGQLQTDLQPAEFCGGECFYTGTSTHVGSCWMYRSVVVQASDPSAAVRLQAIFSESFSQ